MPKPLTDSTQDYLKVIYELTENGNPASTTALAARLQVAPASVTGMMQRLASTKPALVEYHKHQGVLLTARGKHAALEVIRHHRLIESWLVQTLGYSWDEVHSEAEKLEHVISEEFEERIAAAMGYPLRDPHGEPIPSADLVMPQDPYIALSKLQPQQEACVRRVHAKDPGFLKHLEELGLVIGARLQALEVSRYDQVMQIRLRGREEAMALGPAITNRVFVEISK
ncbi:MAG TPA: metal-dependent transcriptional regulator [Anaerolineales bacterium]|nr:metal-dependent transcriptional regulator [Anaerolineales bacterium]